MGTLRSLRTALAGTALLLLSTWISCSGGGTTQTTTPPPSTTTIGSGGGTITAPAGSPIAGTQVVIGSNSFIDPTATANIGLGSQETLPKALEASTQAISCGKTLEIQSSSTMMVIKPMAVTMPYNPQGLNSNDVPCVVYYDSTRNEYTPVTITGLNTNQRTISFYAYKMGKYSIIGIPGLGNTLSSQVENEQQKNLPANAISSTLSVDTGYKGEYDNFPIVNFGTYSSTEGSCVGMSSFAAWYYKFKKQLTGKGLFSQYGTEDSREIAIRAQTFSNALYETALTISQSVLSASTKAQMVITQLKLTNYPILVEFRTSLISGSHCVMLIKYDDSTGRFYVYDPNMPLEIAKYPRSFKWNKGPNSSFSDYDGFSDANQPNYYTFMEVFAPTSEFENIYQQSVLGWNSSSFDKITISSPSIQNGKYFASYGQTKISINGTVSNTFQNSKYVHFLINNNYKTYVDMVGQSFSINNLDLKWKNNGECEIVLVTNKDKNAWASGQSAYYRFVVVANQPPTTPVISGPSTLTVGQTGTYSLSSTDPDGDSITYLQSPAVSGASISGSTLTFTPSIGGSVTLSVIARDSKGVDSPAGSKMVTVSTNRPPTTPIISGPSTLTVGQTGTYSLSSTDPDGDSITYLQSPAVSGASISGSTLTFTPSAGGSVTLSVVARDSKGADSSAGTFFITVPDSGSSHRIKQQDVYNSENVIIGSFRFSYPGNNTVRNDYYDPALGLTVYWVYSLDGMGHVTREESYKATGELISYAIYSLDGRGLPTNITYYNPSGVVVNYITQNFDNLKLKTQYQQFDNLHLLTLNRVFDYNTNNIRIGSRSYNISNNFIGSAIYEYSNNLINKITSYSSTNVKGNSRVFTYEPFPSQFDLMVFGSW